VLFIIYLAGLAPCRWCPLNSHVRQRRRHVQNASGVSACRRGLNSHDAAEPRSRASGDEVAYGGKWHMQVKDQRALRARMTKLQLRATRIGKLVCGAVAGRATGAASGRARAGCEARWRGQPTQRKRGVPSAVARNALPNPSFKRTANGVSPWPRGRVGYHRPRGQGAPPLAAA
jgi:hypothetical protein